MVWISHGFHRGWLGARISLVTSRLIAKLKAWRANRADHPELRGF